MCGGGVVVAAAATAAALLLLTALVGGAVAASDSHHDGGRGLSLGVVAPQHAPPYHLQLRCSPARATSSTPAPATTPAPALRRLSWLIITGEEEQLVPTTRADGELLLEVTPAMSGARVQCRAHAARGGVSLAPPLVVWPHSPARPSPHFSPHRVYVTAGAGAATARAGSTLAARCSSINPPRPDAHLYYLHAVLQAARGDSEREVFSALVTSPRRGEAGGGVVLRPTDHGARLYCVARWFERADARYRGPRALRSAPLTLLVEPALDVAAGCYDSVWLWAAAGAAGLTWAVLLAALLAASGLRLARRRRAQQSAAAAAGRSLPRVVSMRAARSLAAANVKLAPAPPAPPGDRDDYVEYVNLRDLHCGGEPYM